MGAYIYAITKTEYCKELGHRVGVMEFLFKPHGYADAKQERYEQSLINKVERRWEGKSLPVIVRRHSKYTEVNGVAIAPKYYFWDGQSPFWNDYAHKPLLEAVLSDLVSK